MAALDCLDATVITVILLTEFDEQHPCRGHCTLGVGGYTLEIACISGVQVADAEA